MFSAADTGFMALALQLAELGRYTTSPNRNVGALIVKYWTLECLFQNIT